MWTTLLCHHFKAHSFSSLCDSITGKNCYFVDCKNKKKKKKRKKERIKVVYDVLVNDSHILRTAWEEGFWSWEKSNA